MFRRRHIPTLLLFTMAIIVGLSAGSPRVAADDSALWKALRTGESIALVRHAIAPGTGDPAEFILGNCETQRNLSAEGRAQASRIGARFRANGLSTARIVSSQWCRCLETASLLDLGPVEELAVLNSFYQHAERRDVQTQALTTWLAEQGRREPLVLVTHQVNITALTDHYPSSGELLIIRRSEDGEILLVGSIRTE
jgi:phosphohistidine phosphatase SixA